MSQSYQKISKNFKGNGSVTNFVIKNNGAPAKFILGEHSLYEGDLPNWIDNAEGYYTVEEVYGENASLSTRRFGKDLEIIFDSISGRAGSVEGRLSLEGKEKVEVTFPWNTDIVSNTKSVTMSMELSNDRFIINSGYRTDILGWNDSVAASYLDSFVKESDNIGVYFNIKNTNLNGLYLSSDGLKSDPIGTKVIYGNKEEEYFLPLNIISGRVSNSFSASVVPGKYYIVAVEKGSYNKTPVIQFSNTTQGTFSSFELPKNYTFNGNEAAIVKAPGGSENMTLEYESDKMPFMFLFEPNEELEEQIIKLKLVDRNHLDIDKFKAENDKYLDFLPLELKTDNSSPFRFKVDWLTGSGYLEILPSIAADPKYFSNKYADTTSLIKATAATGEETSISIYREVRPYRDIENLKGEITDAISGKYIGKDSIMTMLQSRESVRIASNSIRKLVTPSDKEALEISIPADKPGNVPHELFFDKVDGEVVLNIQESSIEGEDLRSIFGLSLYDNSFYFLELTLRNDEENMNASLELSNMTYLSTVGVEAKGSSAIALTKGQAKTFRYLVPPADLDLKTIPKEITDYMNTYSLNTTGLTTLFNKRPSVDNSFAGYYIYLNPSNTKKDALKMTSLVVRELKIPVKKKINPYLPIQSRAEYSDFIDNTTTFIIRVDELERDYNLATEEGIKLEADSYKNLLTLFVEAEKSIREIEYLMSKYENEDRETALYKVENDGRSHTMGFSSSMGWLSSITITPSGAVIQGEKNRIIGSTSIGALYGKKMVLGKEPTAADREHDKIYREATEEREGFMAIWDAENKRWASNLNKEGQYFYRYDDKESVGSLVGYMVMNSQEIAAYQFPAVREGFDGVVPPDMNNPLTTQDEYPVFKITGSGSVEINNLVVRSASEEVQSTVDLMDSIRILRYDYQGEKITRRGIVFIGID